MVIPWYVCWSFDLLLLLLLALDFAIFVKIRSLYEPAEKWNDRKFQNSNQILSGRTIQVIPYDATGCISWKYFSSLPLANYTMATIQSDVKTTKFGTTNNNHNGSKFAASLFQYFVCLLFGRIISPYDGNLNSMYNSTVNKRKLNSFHSFRSVTVMDSSE